MYKDSVLTEFTDLAERTSMYTDYVVLSNHTTVKIKTQSFENTGGRKTLQHVTHQSGINSDRIPGRKLCTYFC